MCEDSQRSVLPLNRAIRPSSPTAQPAPLLEKPRAWKPIEPSGFHESPSSVDTSAPLGPTASSVAGLLPGTWATAERKALGPGPFGNAQVLPPSVVRAQILPPLSGWL